MRGQVLGHHDDSPSPNAELRVRDSQQPVSFSAPDGLLKIALKFKKPFVFLILDAQALS
jgi:hypothetical protein